jgi:hypothetical protein
MPNQSMEPAGVSQKFPAIVVLPIVG